jgi:hypothetical protein
MAVVTVRVAKRTNPCASTPYARHVSATGATTGRHGPSSHAKRSSQTVYSRAHQCLTLEHIWNLSRARNHARVAHRARILSRHRLDSLVDVFQTAAVRDTAGVGAESLIGVPDRLRAHGL